VKSSGLTDKLSGFTAEQIVVGMDCWALSIGPLLHQRHPQQTIWPLMDVNGANYLLPRVRLTYLRYGRSFRGAPSHEPT
jgi:hypothetical protein